jgi:hypothetical protein
MTEYSRILDGYFTSTGSAQVINIPFQPNRIQMWNYSSYATPAQHGIPEAFWDVNMGSGGGVVKLFNSTPVLTTDVITSGGFSTFSAGQLLQYGTQVQIASSTKGSSTTTFTTASAHGYTTGQIVVFQGLYNTGSTTGMPQLTGIPFAVTVTGTTTFTIAWNSNGSGYTNLTGSPTGAYVKQVLYPYLYAPGVAVISALSYGTTTTVTTSAPNNFVLGQQVAFHIPSAWGPTQFNSTASNVNSLTPGSPIYGFVTAINSTTQFVVNITSTSYTTFSTSGITVAQVKAGLSPPQVVAVGDVNTGGVQYSGGAYYPSPLINSTSTINGPAISGAFVNNTSQGFIIGAGSSVTDSSSVLVGASGNVIYWTAWRGD